MIENLLFVTLLAVTPLATGDSAAATHSLRVVAVEGVPSDSIFHADFMAGFDEVLAARSFTIDPRSPGADGPQGLERPNRFEPVEGPVGDEEWSLQVVVGAPPPFTARRRSRASGGAGGVVVDPKLRASRGMTVALTVTSPEDARKRVAPAAERFAFAFPQSLAPAQLLQNVPQGFRFPWREAGRATARLALELLHHRSGELAANTRCDLTPAIRADSNR